MSTRWNIKSYLSSFLFVELSIQPMTTSCCAELQIKVSFVRFSKEVFLIPSFTARLLGTYKLPPNLPIEMSFRGYLDFSGLSRALNETS